MNRGDQRVLGERRDLLPSDQAVGATTALPPEADRLAELERFLEDSPDLDEITAAIHDLARGREPKFRRKQPPVIIVIVVAVYGVISLAFFLNVNAELGFPLGLNGILWMPWMSAMTIAFRFSFMGVAYGILGGFLFARRKKRKVVSK